jgi:hypothetical protein
MPAHDGAVTLLPAGAGRDGDHHSLLATTYQLWRPKHTLAGSSMHEAAQNRTARHDRPAVPRASV